MTQLVKQFEITASAVRSALTADGCPPLDAPGLKLHERLTLIDQSLERVAEKGDYQPLLSSWSK